MRLTGIDDLADHPGNGTERLDNSLGVWLGKYRLVTQRKSIWLTSRKLRFQNSPGLHNGLLA